MAAHHDLHHVPSAQHHNIQKFTPSTIPPVPPIPFPLPERPPQNFRSLSFSKPTILKFEEFPNMNLAFYLDLVSPNDVSSLPDSIITSPRQERLRAEKRMDFPGRKSSLPLPGAKMAQVMTFNMPGWKTDVKITVLDREFHVHSIVLRLYSGFFRRVCDVVDRELEGVAPTNSRFRYEFVAVGTEDSIGGGHGGGEWTLERAIERPTTPSPSPLLPPKDHGPNPSHNPLNGNSPSSPPPPPQSEHVQVFTKLLTAFYNKPFSILSFAELLTITNLAEQFQSIPCLSSALYVALWSSPALVKEIGENCGEMAKLAVRLRHGLLFREALVHVVSGWKGWMSEFDGEYRLVCTVVKAYNGVCEKVLRVNGEVFGVLGKENGGRVREMVCEVLGTMDKGEGLMENRGLYESLRALVEREEGLNGLRAGLRELLANKLVLERSMGDDGVEKTGFMCAEIEDDELPWDVDEDDW